MFGRTAEHGGERGRAHGGGPRAKSCQGQGGGPEVGIWLPERNDR